jgi:hypothetical protein
VVLALGALRGGVSWSELGAQGHVTVAVILSKTGKPCGADAGHVEPLTTWLRTYHCADIFPLLMQ